MRELEEIIITPKAKNLCYDDSLRLLFHHYPYGASDKRNCILLDGQQNIIAIQWNGEEYTSTVYSEDLINPNNYIILNNCKKLEGQYRYKDFESILKPFLIKNKDNLFNN